MGRPKKQEVTMGASAPVAKAPGAAVLPPSVIIEDVLFRVRHDIAPKDEIFIPASNPGYHWHGRIFDILMDILENRGILLTGHAGVGKTSLFEEVAARVNQPIVRPVCNGQMTTGDMLGYMIARQGNVVWIDGALADAMRTGKWVVLDEIDFADPSILSSLNMVLEAISPHSPNRRIILKENAGELIIAHPDFRIFATANTAGCMEEFRPMYSGAYKMNQAFLSRFRLYFMDYPPAPVEVIILSHYTKVSDKFLTRIVNGANQIRDAHKNGILPLTCSIRQLIDWVLLVERHLNRLKAKAGAGGAAPTPAAILDIILDCAEPALLTRFSFEDALTVKDTLQRAIEGK